MDAFLFPLDGFCYMWLSPNSWGPQPRYNSTITTVQYVTSLSKYWKVIHIMYTEKSVEYVNCLTHCIALACVCVHVYVWCVHVCMCACMHVCMLLCVHVYMCVHDYVCVCVCVCVCVVWHACMYMCVYMNAHYVCMCVCVSNQGTTSPNKNRPSCYCKFTCVCQLQWNPSHGNFQTLPITAKMAIINNKTSSTSRISFRQLAIFRRVLKGTRNEMVTSFNMVLERKGPLLHVHVKHSSLVTPPLHIQICTCVFHSSSMSQQRRVAEENESPEHGSDDV